MRNASLHLSFELMILAHGNDTQPDWPHKRRIVVDFAEFHEFVMTFFLLFFDFFKFCTDIACRSTGTTVFGTKLDIGGMMKT